MRRILVPALALLFARILGFAGTEIYSPRDSSPGGTEVTLAEDAGSFTLGNGLITARIEKRSGKLVSLGYKGLELLGRNRGGANGGFWSSVGNGRPGSSNTAAVRVNPADNGGSRAEISCQLHNDPSSPTARSMRIIATLWREESPASTSMRP
ncbi:MAG TPA: hypothetical protein VNZ64_22020 [Candidatus Acidoferrum sp.]|jgi:hypothetical protein|nr:hypothetical protein [Candidatus Acidoferrum sp.]